MSGIGGARAPWPSAASEGGGVLRHAPAAGPGARPGVPAGGWHRDPASAPEGRWWRPGLAEGSEADRAGDLLPRGQDGGRVVWADRATLLAACRGRLVYCISPISAFERLYGPGEGMRCAAAWGGEIARLVFEAGGYPLVPAVIGGAALEAGMADPGWLWWMDRDHVAQARCDIAAAFWNDLLDDCGGGKVEVLRVAEHGGEPGWHCHRALLELPPGAAGADNIGTSEVVAGAAGAAR